MLLPFKTILHFSFNLLHYVLITARCLPFENTTLALDLRFNPLEALKSQSYS